MNCKVSVRMAGFTFPRYSQCSREAVKDGFCKQHHPDAKKARLEASSRRWQEKHDKSDSARLYRALKENEQLRAELEALKAERSKQS